MEKIHFLNGKLEGGKIVTEKSVSEIAELVKEKNIVIIKNLFTPEQMVSLRHSVFNWGKVTPPVIHDDFRGNYHSLKAKVSNIQQAPHVFHDYNFNDFTKLPEDLNKKLFKLFDNLRIFYNSLTQYTAPLGLIEGAAYFHPQLIHYPMGGGFFGRHNHNLLPQKIGFILSLSDYGKDYMSGGTCFVINNEIIDIEGKLGIGDLCLWPNDIDHWVKQSTLEDKFDWDSEKGRWVATLAYFDPFGG